MPGIRMPGMCIKMKSRLSKEPYMYIGIWTYADVCCRVLMYAFVCSRMLTYTERGGVYVNRHMDVHMYMPKP